MSKIYEKSYSNSEGVNNADAGSDKIIEKLIVNIINNHNVSLYLLIT